MNYTNAVGIVRVNRHTGEREMVRGLPSKLKPAERERFAHTGRADDTHDWYRIRQFGENFPEAKNQEPQQ